MRHEKKARSARVREGDERTEERYSRERLEKAVGQGDAEVACRLGLMYETAQGVEGSKKAAELYGRIAGND